MKNILNYLKLHRDELTVLFECMNRAGSGIPMNPYTLVFLHKVTDMKSLSPLRIKYSILAMGLTLTQHRFKWEITNEIYFTPNLVEKVFNRGMKRYKEGVQINIPIHDAFHKQGHTFFLCPIFTELCDS